MQVANGTACQKIKAVGFGQAFQMPRLKHVQIFDFRKSHSPPWALFEHRKDLRASR